MSTNIEIEAKALVKLDEFKKINNYFKVKKENAYVQENFYIDTKDLTLSNYGVALRIRVKNNSYELTLKTPLSEGQLEKNQNLTKTEFNNFKEKKVFPEGDIRRFLIMLGFDIDNLGFVTSLKTTRVDIPYKEGLLSLDKNEYNGKTDYEIELEYNSKVGAITELENLFKELNILFKENKVSKHRRAYITTKQL